MVCLYSRRLSAPVVSAHIHTTAPEQWNTAGVCKKDGKLFLFHLQDCCRRRYDIPFIFKVITFSQRGQVRPAVSVHCWTEVLCWRDPALQRRYLTATQVSSICKEDYTGYCSTLDEGCSISHGQSSKTMGSSIFKNCGIICHVFVQRHLVTDSGEPRARTARVVCRTMHTLLGLARDSCAPISAFTLEYFAVLPKM